MLFQEHSCALHHRIHTVTHISAPPLRIKTTTQGLLTLSTRLTQNKISVALMMSTARTCDSFISGVPVLHQNRKGRVEISDMMRSGGGSSP